MIIFLFWMLLERFVPRAAVQIQFLLRPRQLPDLIPETQCTEGVIAFSENENSFTRSLEENKEPQIESKVWEEIVNFATCLTECKPNTDGKSQDNFAENFEKNTEPQISNLSRSLTDVNDDTENGTNASKDVDNNTAKANLSFIASLTDTHTCTESRSEDNVAKNLDESTELQSISNTMPCLTASELVRNLECQYDLLDILVGSDCISSVEVEEVRSLVNLQQQNRKLLKYINSSKLAIFIEGLEKANQRHLANLIRRTTGLPLGDTSTTYTREEDDRPLDDEDRRPIERTYELLVCDIHTEGLVNQLLALNCISIAQMATVKGLGAKTHYEANRELLSIMLRRSLRQLNVFYDCLRRDHEHIWNVLSQFIDEGDNKKLMKVEFQYGMNYSYTNLAQECKSKIAEETLQLVQSVENVENVIQTKDQTIFVVIRKGQNESGEAIHNFDYVKHEIEKVFDGLPENAYHPVDVTSAEFVKRNGHNRSEISGVDQSSDCISSKSNLDFLQCEKTQSQEHQGGQVHCGAEDVEDVGNYSFHQNTTLSKLVSDENSIMAITAINQGIRKSSVNVEESKININDHADNGNSNCERTEGNFESQRKVSDNVVDQEDRDDSAGGASNDDQDQLLSASSPFVKDSHQMDSRPIGINPANLHTSTSELSHSTRRIGKVNASDSVQVASVNQTSVSPDSPTVKRASQIESKNVTGRSATSAASLRSFFGRSKSSRPRSSGQALPKRILITLGYETTVSSMEQRIFEINLEKRDTINVINSTSADIWGESSACVVSNVLYAVGLGGGACNELWAWSASRDEWTRRADMSSGRRYQSVTSVDDKIYVLGGWVGTNNTTLDDILCYDINSNKWSEAGQLCHAVRNAACVTYKHLVYVFGGVDKDDKAVNHVQVYDTTTRNVLLASNPMPCADGLMRAVLWRSKALLVGDETCYIYDFESSTWQERKRFKTGVIQFGLTLDNNTLYITGGGTCSAAGVWTCRADVKSLIVNDFISDNKDAEWKHFATLPTSAFISAYSPVPLMM